MLNHPRFDPLTSLKDQKRLLTAKKRRLETLIKTIDRTIHSMQQNTPADTEELYGNFNEKEMEERRDGILIDQGLADKFLEAQLHPHLFEHACAAVKQPLTLRRHAGYDHGYYFISTFINDHLDHHARILLRG